MLQRSYGTATKEKKVVLHNSPKIFHRGEEPRSSIVCVKFEGPERGTVQELPAVPPVLAWVGVKQTRMLEIGMH